MKIKTSRFWAKDIAVVVASGPGIINIANGAIIFPETAPPVTPAVCGKGPWATFALVINEKAPLEKWHIDSGIFGLYLNMLANICRKDPKIDLTENTIRSLTLEYGLLSEMVIGLIKDLDAGLWMKVLAREEES